MKKFILVLMFVFLSSCVSGPSKEELLKADFGMKPENYEEKIKNAMITSLIDPTSPIYKINPIVKKSVFNGILRGGGYTHGWLSCGSVNSKNRFGGYAGWQRFSAFFTGNFEPEIRFGILAQSRGC